VGDSSVLRHKQDHIAVQLAKAKQASDEVEASNLFERLKAINGELRQANRETLEVLADARTAKNGPLRLQAIARLEKQAEVGARLLELEGKLLGELNDPDKGSGRVVINVLVRKSGYPPDWQPASPVMVEMEPAGSGHPPASSRFIPRIAGSAPRRDRA
jgi:hypothetical protein